MLTEVDMITVNIPMLRMRKLRLREGKGLVQQVSDRDRILTKSVGHRVYKALLSPLPTPPQTPNTHQRLQLSQ